MDITLPPLPFKPNSSEVTFYSFAENWKIVHVKEMGKHKFYFMKPSLEKKDCYPLSRGQYEELKSKDKEYRQDPCSNVGKKSTTGIFIDTKWTADEIKAFDRSVWDDLIK